MTRTQKLGLCTWLPEDPVCLAEVNDNFTRLDDSGGRALRLAEAAMVNLGGLMAAQAHQGGHAAYANMQVDAFRDSAQISAYAGVFYRGNCVELLTAGLADGTVKSSTIGGSGDFNAANITRTVNVTQTWANLFTFHPDAFGTLTNLHLQTANSSSTSQASQVKLSIWDAERDGNHFARQRRRSARGFPGRAVARSEQAVCDEAVDRVCEERLGFDVEPCFFRYARDLQHRQRHHAGNTHPGGDSAR